MVYLFLVGLVIRLLIIVNQKSECLFKRIIKNTLILNCFNNLKWNDIDSWIIFTGDGVYKVNKKSFGAKFHRKNYKIYSVL